MVKAISEAARGASGETSKYTGPPFVMGGPSTMLCMLMRPIKIKEGHATVMLFPFDRNW